MNQPGPVDPVIPADRLDDALRNYAASELRRAIACLAWRGPRLHEGVHQARKSLRRTRSVLALGSPALGPGAALIDRECRSMNRRLSRLRDAQALVTTLDHLIGREETAESLLVLRRVRRIAARARAECARLALAGAPDLAGARALLTALLGALLSLPWQTLTDASVRQALQDSVVRAEEAGQRARTSSRAPDWHRWRRRARRVSQQYRALGDFVEHSGVKKHSKVLAVLLGEAQDYALLREYSRRDSMFAETDRKVLRALGATGMQHLRERIATSAGAAKSAVDEPGAESTPN